MSAQFLGAFKQGVNQLSLVLTRKICSQNQMSAQFGLIEREPDLKRQTRLYTGKGEEKEETSLVWLGDFKQQGVDQLSLAGGF
jgi:hypothetical protein